MSTLNVTQVGDRQLVVTRWFNASPELVYRAHMDPELTAKWMIPEDGWTLSIEATGDNVYRYTWTGPDMQMPMTMRVLEAEPPHRIVHTELFDEDWTGGETRNETLFKADGTGTRMELTITYQSAEGRAAALASQMDQGMAACYAVLDGLLATLG